MSYLVLARKYRPNTFDQVIGQEGVVRTIKNAIGMDRVAHAYLFTGARGVGKTTVARILAKALNCESGPTPDPDIDCTQCQEIARGGSPDVFEIDGASNTGVDDVRALRDNSNYLPAHSRFKIYIIDEVHMLSTSAFNALLKTLEEPPAHVKFIFATTEPHKIPLTVLSRCQRFDFKRIPTDAICAHVEKVLAEEKMHIDENGLRTIARQAGGSVRDALSLTDQVLAFGGDRISAQQVRTALGLAGTEIYEQVVAAVIERRPDELMHLTQRLFDEGYDLKRFLEGLLWHIHHLILFSALSEPGDLLDLLDEERERMQKQATRADPLRWHQIFDVLAKTANELAHNPYPRLVLETALLRLSAIEPVVAVDDLLARVEQLAERLSHGPAEALAPGDLQARRTSQPSPAPSTRTQQTSRATSPAEKRSAAPQPVKPDKRPPGADLSGQQAWEQLVAYIHRQRPSLASFLSHAHPRKVGSGTVCIAFERTSFFADQVGAARNRRDIERLSAEFFGRPTELRIEDLKSEERPSLAQARELAAKEADDELRRRALEHPMVQEAIRVFGAEVDHIKTHSGSKG